MNMKFLDRATIGTVNRTSEGYVTARAKAVRTGVQDYLASELGVDAKVFPKDRQFIRHDGILDAWVRVNRPESEVFAIDSISGFIHAPVTNDHPSQMVDADNWKSLAVGEVGANVLRDGEYLALDLILKDAAAIRDFEGGKKELSAGYTAEIEFVDGVAEYDAIMKNIRINHLALVDKGRAGRARIGDSAANQWGVSPLTTEKGPEMEMKAVAIGDKAVNVAATDADTLTKALTDKDTAIGELKAKLADAESKILTDEQIQAKAKEIADAMARREAVKAKFGDEAIKDASDAEIAGMFKIIDKAPAQDDTARKALADAMKGKKEDKDGVKAGFAQFMKKKDEK